MLIYEIYQENEVWMAIADKYPQFQKLYQEFKRWKKFGLARFSRHAVLTNLLERSIPAIERDIDRFLTAGWSAPDDPDIISYIKAATDIAKNLEKDKKEIEQYFDNMRKKGIAEGFRWAVGQNKKYAQAPNRQNDSTILWVNPSELIPLIDPDWRVSPDDRQNHIGARMDKASAHAQSGGWFDPADVGYSNHKAEYPIFIGNGRHRIAAAAKAGEEWVPINVYDEDVAKIQAILTTKPT